MKTRILVGILLALFLISMLYFGGFYYLSAIALVSFAATYEVAHVITRTLDARYASASRVRMKSTLFSSAHARTARLNSFFSITQSKVTKISRYGHASSLPL